MKTKTLNFKTPIEEIFFRCSKIGLLANGLQRNDLSENQKQRIAELKAIPETVIGLTENQQKELDKRLQEVAEGKKLAKGVQDKVNDYKERLTSFKSLTTTQSEELYTLIEKQCLPPSLSQGAKTYIKDVWLENEKDFREEISSKHTRKGIQGEEDAINLISYVDGFMYSKNKTRITRKNLTGECDIDTLFEDIDSKPRIIDDLKCSWNPKTFMSSTISTTEEWQGRAYLHLYNADIFRLRRCLVDCPPDVYADELKKFCWDKQIIDSELPEYKELIDQFNSNFLYEHSGNYTQEERVKTFSFYRDLDKETILLKSIELGLEYYKTITLNMIE
jgi:hypothetical protein